MTLFTATAAEGYSSQRMPQPAFADGPWGEAIRYWLNVRKLRQSDLVARTDLQANTISRATRGFHTTTRVLEKLAKALDIRFDEILVSPDRKSANEERRRLAVEISEQVLRTMEARAGQPPLPTLPSDLTMAESVKLAAAIGDRAIAKQKAERLAAEEQAEKLRAKKSHDNSVRRVRRS